MYITCSQVYALEHMRNIHINPSPCSEMENKLLPKALVRNLTKAINFTSASVLHSNFEMRATNSDIKINIYSLLYNKSLDLMFTLH